ncbi:bestrophin family protein [Halomonas organivorans]|uniref:Putative membrane protein n=1 Tax=Halomonas organivorans TaxID=257772 RepID=A0A7W5BXF4_9GAMM|nr:bestrophin family protein [Halomonas organivorans]MBB3140920.1 putative membrane protein [Halomonas organivorans]
MIVHSNPSPGWIELLITLKGSIAKRIAIRCLLITVLAALIVFIEGMYPGGFHRVSATPFTLLGLSLSIFMSFRNNACYARWWEGRKAWGRVVWEVRSFARESHVIADAQLRATLLQALCGYAHALNARLRNEDEFDAARTWLDAERTRYGHNVTDGILRDIGGRCSALASDEAISEWRYITLEQRLLGLSEAQASCERIQNTPLPFPYTLLLHRTTLIFCLLLPFVLAQPLGWLAPLFTTIVSYTFFGLDTIGDELENPFGYDDNDLPTDAIVRHIERDMLDSAGHVELPPAREPSDGVLT